jgi:pimeloyl-ACP methyl ester carboxylesterase
MRLSIHASTAWAPAVALLALTSILNRAAAAEAPAIPRIIPPAGIEVPAEELSRLKETLARLDARLEKEPIGEGRTRDRLPDVQIYLKAVRYAIDHGEFYDVKDVGRAGDLLKTAGQRLDLLQKGQAPWTAARGLVVRGYRSELDDSVQPYGLVIPEQLDLSKPVPLYVWLHGRGDKMTDLQFIHQRQTSVGQIAPPNAIVLHPFGRYCNAFKFAGEVDVAEAMHDVRTHYKIDPDRLVLWGFSMGGAGAWHLGAHYPDRWVAVSPGAGFAETARYQNLKPESVPAYERTLWGLYDVPGYVRNLFNVPVIAYSGEEDKQIQAARIMEEAYQDENQKLRHLIGPGMGHKYHPDTLKELAGLIDERVQAGKDRQPKTISLQTRTLRYNRYAWVSITELVEHWQDTRVDATASDDHRLTVKTKNVASLEISTPWEGNEFPPAATVDIDGQKLLLSQRGYPGKLAALERRGGRWTLASLERQQESSELLRKEPGRQGPIDDAFMRRFLVVEPTGKSQHPLVDDWVQNELAHFKERWRRLFRGDLRTIKDTDVTDEEAKRNNLVVWGDRTSNRYLAKLSDRLPIQWSASAISVGDRSFDAAGHVLAMIYPNPLDPNRYVVLNSGPTFREAHDRSNSLQTPKLPDWAVIDLSQPPDDKAPGRVAAAGFFDERWNLSGK